MSKEQAERMRLALTMLDRELLQMQRQNRSSWPNIVSDLADVIRDALGMNGYPLRNIKNGGRLYQEYRTRLESNQ